MNRNCKCSGKYRRTDIEPVIVKGETYYRDTDPLKANWKCDKCGDIRTQRKRQSVKKGI